jgi:hypothetical protein
MTSSLRSPDETDETTGSITRLRFVWFTSIFCTPSSSLAPSKTVYVTNLTFFNFYFENFIWRKSLTRSSEGKMQIHNQRQRTAWGTVMNPTGHYAHMFEERWKKKIYPIDNRDPDEEEIKIPPPYPHKRKKFNYFSHLKDPYFLCPPEWKRSETFSFWIKKIWLSNRKKKHKCHHDEPWRCRQTDESLVKESQAMWWITIWRYSTIFEMCPP